ncbi:MAG: Long-chain-fatty-acid--CoA ligase [Candidatus Heimdallarchaeota archaeon LC_3]|nr:MAG: Long-chain-fatty-acid--CoA ligase [Candidatus Heimdallarchaeota archaeon LC_3]
MSYVWHKIWPESVPKDLELLDINLIDMLAKHIPENENSTYLQFMKKSWTYGEIYSDVKALAAFLHKNGITSEDKVAILMPNIPQFVVTFFAVQYLGAVGSLLNTLYVSSEFKHTLNDSGATAIIAADFMYDEIIPIKEETSLQLVIITSIGDVLSGATSFLGKKLGKIPTPKKKDPTAILWNKAISEGRSFDSPNKVRKDPEDVAVLIYTGGTTGPSKGAMSTHRNFSHQADFLGHWTPQPVNPEEDAFVGALPLFHSYGLTVGLLSATYHGTRFVLIPNPRDIDNLLKQIVKTKATYLPGVPTLYIAMLNHPDIKKYDLSSIKFCLSGAAPLPAEVQKQFEKLTGAVLLEGYGLTETSPISHANPAKDDSKRKIGSVGIPISNTHSKIVNLETGEEVPIGEEGEICMKGPHIMKGYWKKPVETAKVIDSDGYFHSGDVGKMDEEGFFYITDRIKDMIIVSGYKVFPRDVEEVLFKHPAVENAAVIGVPDERTTERVKAFVVLKEGKDATETELLKFCEENLASYRKPKELEIRKDLPLSMIGKVLRRELRQEELKK